jgi:hypothetical protein
MADRENREIYNNLFKVQGDCYRLRNWILLPIILTLSVAVNLKTKGKILPVLISYPCQFGRECSSSTLLLRRS